MSTSKSQFSAQYASLSEAFGNPTREVVGVFVDVGGARFAAKFVNATVDPDADGYTSISGPISVGAIYRDDNVNFCYVSNIFQMSQEQFVKFIGAAKQINRY